MRDENVAERYNNKVMRRKRLLRYISKISADSHDIKRVI